MPSSGIHLSRFPFQRSTFNRSIVKGDPGLRHPYEYAPTHVCLVRDGLDDEDFFSLRWKSPIDIGAYPVK